MKENFISIHFIFLVLILDKILDETCPNRLVFVIKDIIMLIEVMLSQDSSRSINDYVSSMPTKVSLSLSYQY